MSTADWTQVSLLTFWIALGAYLAAMLAYFYFLAFKRLTVGRVASVLAWTGVVANLVSVITRGLAAQRVPWGNMYEYSILMSVLLVAGYLVIAEWRSGARALGGFVMLMAIVSMAVANMFLYTGPGPLVPALDSVWLKIHVFVIVVASALLTLGSGIFTPLYLWKARRERISSERVDAELDALTADRMPPVMGGAVDELPPHFLAGADEPDAKAAGRGRGWLPPSETLDRLAYRTIAFGFPLWTAAVIFGAIWAERAWGRYWGWDPKEVWAFITWVVYAGYLHARATAGWKGKRAAVIALAGFASFLIGYYVVNTIIPGLHSYSGV